MNEQSFLDREANPLGGKVPVSLHVHGRGLTDRALEMTRRGFFDFVTAYNLSLCTTLREEMRVDRQTHAIFEVNQGVFRVDVLVDPEEDDADYFGGIVVQLQRFTEAGLPYRNNVNFDWGGSAETRPRADNAYPKPEHREVIPEAKTFGRNFAVSGPLGDVQGGSATDTLIFQIEARGDLTKNPVAAGLVKIFRILSPQLGDIASHANEPGQYIVSAAKEYSAVDGYRASGFFIGGQTMPIPATPWSAAGGDPDSIRLYTIGFEPETFADANQAQGVLVLLWGDRVYLYDTLLPTMGWVVCTEIVYSSPIHNEFGFTFELRAPRGEAGPIELICSGLNGNGPCSGFEVRIGSRGPSTRSVTGSIQPYYLSELADVNSSTLRLQKTLQRSYTFDEIAQTVDYPGYYAQGLSETRTASTEYTQGEYTTSFARDPFVGGVTSTTYSKSVTYTSNVSYIDALEFVLDVGPGMPAFYHGQFVRTTILSTSTVSFAGSGFGSASYTYLTATAEHLATNGGGSDTGPQHDYSAMDAHAKRLALRTTFRRGGSWSQSDITSATAIMGAAQLSMTLIAPGGVPVASYPLLDGFGAPVLDAEGYSASLVVPPAMLGPDIWHADNYILLSPPNPAPLVGVYGFFAYIVRPPYPGGGVDPPNFVLGSGGAVADFAGTYESTVDSNTLSGTFTVAQYEALGDINIPAPDEWTGDILLKELRPIYVQGLTGTEYDYSFSRRPDCRPVSDYVYVDPRTGGFIVQYFWEASVDLGGFTYRNPAQIVTTIGNLESSVPLVDVLNEWIELTGKFENEERGPYTTVFINRDAARNVSLI
jgi:hypothetical protein